MATTPRRRASRFSLLLLEDGEVLLSDFSVHYRFTPFATAGSNLHPLSSYPERFVSRSSSAVTRGRIKIGTRNIFFDSDDWRDPIIRIPLVSVNCARPTRDGSRSRSSEDSANRSGPFEDDSESSVLVKANSVTFLKEHGTDHPYIDVQIRGRHVFTPLYSSAVELLDEINTLLEVSSIKARRQRDAKLKQLVQERESRVPFDITLLEHGVKENAVMDSAASAVYAMSRMPGRFRITQHNLYFMPIHGESSRAVERIAVKNISSVRRLRHGCRDAALEVGYRESEETGNASVFATLMIAFATRQFRERAIGILLRVAPKEIELFDRRCLDTALGKWRRGAMSNFDYLMYLNFAAGRSFNDLSQYPVFPWILKDYKSDTLDLATESSFRDLTNPIGALESKRLEVFRQRYEEMPAPRFFYGTHYSTPAYTINYLVRAAPAAMLRLQNGKFDTPDRLFHSISNTWVGVLSNQGDVKELIPEFYTLDYSSGNASGVIAKTSSPGEFLDNVLGLDLGARQDGKRVDDVELPPWADGSSELFVRRNREALESEYVSSRLHHWIDLIYGFKSRSAEASNVFYTDVALPNSLDSERSALLSDEEINQLETVYLEFGRTPERLFRHPHPPRFGDDRDIAVHGAYIAQRIEKPPPFPHNPSTDPESVESDGGVSSSSHSVDLDDSSDDNSSRLDRNVRRLDKPIGRTSVWGSKSRRHDSVLHGASDHVLSPYEPATNNSDENFDKGIPRMATSFVIPSSPSSVQCAIVDLCIAPASAADTQAPFLSDSEGKAPTICTIWDDGHLKVYNGTKTIRSKHVGDACSIAYMNPGLVFFGTPGGNIGVYSIDTGRMDVVQSAAHDAEVNTIEYIQQSRTLISGSRDASVKIWHVERPSHLVASLRLVQELDAECSVEDIAGTVDTTPLPAGAQKTTLLVAALTTDEDILAWEVESGRQDQSFLEPVLRHSNEKAAPRSSDEKSTRVRKLTWLYQGRNRRPALASAHEAEKCLRVWKLDRDGMVAAEAYIPEGGAKCVSSCNESRTLLVGGMNGQISEYDSTGLRLGCIIGGDSEVRNVLIPKGGKEIFVFAGNNKALRVNR